MLKISKRK